jgi:deoxyguanosine kinase
MARLISVEGNIGSGKSTLIKNLKESFKNEQSIIFLTEPVDEWNTIVDSSGETILEKYYHNQEKYAFSFQMMAYITRLIQLKENINSGKIIIMERSLFTDKNIFAKMLYDTGKIEEVEYLIYLRWFDEFIKEIPEITFVYLDIPPEICLLRTIARNRKGEESINIEYLTNCHKYHYTWLNNLPDSNNLYLDDSPDNLSKIKNWLVKFI